MDNAATVGTALDETVVFLRRFRPCRDGTPTHDHLGDILATLDAEAFQHGVAAWVAARTGLPEGVIASDGKTVRRSHDKKGGKAAIHRVSAFGARQRLGLWLNGSFSPIWVGLRWF